MKIVLLPGLDGTGLLFQPLLTVLETTINARDILVISYPRAKLSYKQLILIVLNQLPEENFILVGESFSGNIAYHIAEKNPKYLKSVSIFLGGIV